MNIERREFLFALAGTAASATLSANAQAGSSGTPLAHPNLSADPRRPQFHFLPAANWMNDPNGPIYWNGNYHMFYQYNPHGAFWGDMHWGHAVSKDMLHWKHLPIALSPTPGSPDSEGCFSGTAVVEDGRVLLMYTGVQSVPYSEATNKDGANTFRETQCLAVASDPDLISWSKVSRPVISDPPRGMSVNGFRDPSPWRQGDSWYMVLGSGRASHGGAVLLYRSKDLRSWEFMHVLVHQEFDANGNSNPFDPWDVWECPELFSLGDRHVLIYSTHGKVYWRTGRLNQDSMVFSTEHSGFLDYGTYYAPKTQLDKLGRRIIWGWIQERRPLQEYKSAGWAGAMSLPRVLTLDEDGRLRMEVADTVNQLRAHEESLQITSDNESNHRELNSIRIRNCCGELLCRVRRSSGSFQISLTGSVNNENPWLTWRFDPSNPGNVFIDSHSIPISLRDNEELELHLYADGSVIELCVNKQVAWTKRFYAKSDSSQDLCLNWAGNTADIASLTVWQLAPISNDRLTT
jgi:beta-fructofuranosidase